ncbi:response regulator transcription factor [Eubacterium sp. AB3007]|uniref:response regulator transcription factor n=1 Tax=Eubacterium sp. AB3007 TaxID=1392487 RepID=UPI000485D25E|nr:response regulator transcription factor [Eubacterium sp. AB3007]
MIYCVEDDNSIRDLMIYALNAADMEAEGFPEGGTFWMAMKQELPDLIILDIMLPGEDGISILKRLKASPVTVSIPVILATARGTEYDKVVGLDLGADDYLTKPFGMMEMIARIKAVLRRSRRTGNRTVLQAGPVVIDTGRHTVSVHGRHVALTLKEYDLLHMLIRDPERVFSREQIMQSVWGEDFLGETRTVDVHIGTLRTKLGEAGSMIKTVRGVGYKMENAYE